MGGNNALLYACGADNEDNDMVNYLMNETGADINAMNDFKINLLLMATKKGQLNVLKKLFCSGVDLGYTDRN